MPTAVKRPFSKVPVLAVKTVKITGLVKDGQIEISSFRPGLVGKLRETCARSSGTDEIRYTIRGQGIKIPGHKGFLRARSNKSPLSVLPNSAVAESSLRNATAMKAKVTGKTSFGLRWKFGKTKGLSSGSVDFLYGGFYFRPVVSYAAYAKTDPIRDGLCPLPARKAGPHA